MIPVSNRTIYFTVLFHPNAAVGPINLLVLDSLDLTRGLFARFEQEYIDFTHAYPFEISGYPKPIKRMRKGQKKKMDRKYIPIELPQDKINHPLSPELNLKRKTILQQFLISFSFKAQSAN